MTAPFSDMSAKKQGRSAQPLWRRRLQYFYLRFLRLRGSPQELARGLASGVFAGSFPLFGFQTLIGIAIATLLRGNKILAAAGTWVSNPFTYLPLFAFNYQIGRWLLGSSANPRFDSLDSLKGWADMGIDVSSRLMLGSSIVGLIGSLLCYYGSVPVIHHLQKRRIERRLARISTSSNG